MEKLSKYLPLLFVLSFSLSGIGKTYIPSLVSLLQIIGLLLAIIVIIWDFNKIGQYKIHLIGNVCLLVFIYFLLYSSSLDVFYSLCVTYVFSILCGLSLTLTAKVDKLLVTSFSIVIILNLIVLLYETITGQVIVTVAEGYEVYLGMPIYHFGLFSDPKGGGFCIALMALCLPKEYFWLSVIAFLETILSGCRTSTVLMLVPLFYHLKSCSVKSKVTFAIVIVLSIAYIGKLIDFDIRVIERLFNVFDLTEGGNEDRMAFMRKHFSLMSNNYSFFDYIFGRYEYTRGIVGNGAESMWLDLMLNCGLCLLLVYFSGLLHSFRSKKDVFGKTTIIVIFVLMFVSGLGGGINSGYIFWYFLFKRDITPKKTIHTLSPIS